MTSGQTAAEVKARIIARYEERTASSRAQHEEALRYLPGGETRGATRMSPYPTYMTAGEGAWLRDGDGNRYLDLLNNYTSLAHGHAAPDMVEQAADQLTRGTAWGTVAEAQVRLAKLLVERVPGIDTLRFTNSGTEATMMMMRAARAFSGRDIIVKMDGGYHGSHDFVEVSVSAETDGAGLPRARLESRGVPGEVVNSVLVAPFNDLAAMEALLAAHAAHIAGIILEPMPNAGGMIPPQPGYLAGLRALADRYGVLLLFDEIVTLRLAPGGFQEIAGLKPDLTALGKIIGGGFPVGAFGGRRNIMAQFDPEQHPQPLFHSGTFNGNNMTMTAGEVALRRLDAAAIARINALGETLAAGVNGIFAKLGIRAQCLGYGSMQQIHWTDAELRNMGDARRASLDVGELYALLQVELMNRGVYSSNRGMFSVPTPAQESEIDLALHALEGALETLIPYMREVAPRLLR